MQLTKDEKLTLTVDTDSIDAPDGTDPFATAPFTTPEAISWSVDDGSIVSLTVSEDRLSCEVRANAPGTAVVTVTDASATPRLLVSEVFDVLYEDTPKVKLTAGDVVHQ